MTETWGLVESWLILRDHLCRGEHDPFGIYDWHRRSVGAARDPQVTAPDAPIEAAAKVMRARKIGALPVLQNSALVGVITESDIFRALVEVFESRDPAVRVTFSLTPGEDVLPLVAEIARRRSLRITNFMALPYHDPPLCVVQLTGANTEAALEDVWKSQHRAMHLVHLVPAALVPEASGQPAT